MAKSAPQSTSKSNDKGKKAETKKRLSKKAKLIAGPATLIIALREQKDGTFQTGVTLRQPNEKAKSGVRAKHGTLEAAQAAFDALVQNATAKNWKVKSSVTREAFTEIPDAPVPAAPEPAATGKK